MSGVFYHGYIQFNPDMNDLYDMEHDEAIYVPSEYPFSIPRVYLEGNNELQYPQTASSWLESSVVVVDRNVLAKYSGHSYIEEFNFDTLEKRTFEVKLASVAQIGIDDITQLIDYIDPNIIKKVNTKKEDPTT